MKKIIFLLALIALFVFIFLISDTWQSHQERVVRGGIEYVITKHSLNWDNFFTYIRNIPSTLKKNINSLSRR